MSLVSSGVALTHSCAILRDNGSVDPFGGTHRDWQVHIAALPCRAWVETVVTRTQDDRTVVIEDRRVIVPLATDVTERDRIGTVTTPTGSVLFPGPALITGVITRPDHLELVVERIR